MARASYQGPPVVCSCCASCCSLRPHPPRPLQVYGSGGGASGGASSGVGEQVPGGLDMLKTRGEGGREGGREREREREACFACQPCTLTCSLGPAALGVLASIRLLSPSSVSCLSTCLQEPADQERHPINPMNVNDLRFCGVLGRRHVV
jgi:hypothetical protein